MVRLMFSSSPTSLRQKGALTLLLQREVRALSDLSVALPRGVRHRRTFVDGHDTRWTALQLKPSSNNQINFYNETFARTRGGNL